MHVVQAAAKDCLEIMSNACTAKSAPIELVLAGG